MAEYQVVDKETLDADLKSIGDSIRAKGGTSELFNSAKEMKDAVDAIQTGVKAPVIQPLTVTENGDYTAPPGVDGYSPVSVNVPSGGEGTLLDKFFEGKARTLTSNAVSLRDYAFFNDTTVLECNFPKLKTLGSFITQGSNIITFNIPVANIIAMNSLRSAKKLKNILAPNATYVGAVSCYDTGLEKVDFPKMTSIGDNAFLDSKLLKTVVLRVQKVCTIQATSFNGTPIKSGDGYVYVPKSLVDQYKTATNWVTYAAQIRAIEDYPDITGG